jgi:acyl-CoA thioesterase I
MRGTSNVIFLRFKVVGSFEIGFSSVETINGKHLIDSLMTMFLHFIVVVIFLCIICNSQGAVRVTCIGDSITEGGACNANGYVPVLQSLLGSDYNVTNAGKSSMTQLKKGLCNDLSPCSYWNTNAWQVALNSEPDIVTIMLGTNDAKYYNWEGIQQSEGDYFTLDYVDMIQQLKKLKSNPEVFLMIPPPLFQPVYDMNQTVINNIFPSLMCDLASVMGLTIIDIYSAVKAEAETGTPTNEILCDGCHPTAYGNDILAKTMLPYITASAEKRKERRLISS